MPLRYPIAYTPPTNASKAYAIYGAYNFAHVCQETSIYPAASNVLRVLLSPFITVLKLLASFKINPRIRTVPMIPMTFITSMFM